MVTRILSAIVLTIAWAGMMPTSGAPGREPSATPRRELTLDLGDGVTLKLVEIPAGTFLMGSKFSAEEVARRHGGVSRLFTDEHPRHEVTIGRPFYMGVTPVTVDQFAAFVKDSGYKTDAEKDGWTFVFEIRDGKGVSSTADGASWRKPGFEQTGNHPVVHISWQDAVAFCDWLSKKSGKPVRLPTEAEWEFAARAGTGAPFAFGESVGCRDVHFNSLFPYEERRERRKWYIPLCIPTPRPLEVGSFPPNLWGLHDMHGNVQEFTSSPWRDSHVDLPRNGVYRRVGDEEWLVVKGGSWFDPAVACRSAARRRRHRTEMDTNLGFRVLREL